MQMVNPLLILMLQIVRQFWVADCRYVGLAGKLVRYTLLRNLFVRLHLHVLELWEIPMLVR